MKKLALFLLLTLGTANIIFAQEEPVTLKSLAISAMQQYAEELEMRGDMIEANNVKARIAQLQADMVIASKKVNTQAACCELTPSAKPAKKIVPVYAGPNADLKRQLAEEDQMLADLTSEIDQLRHQTQAHE